MLELVLAPTDLGSVREPLSAPVPAQDPELALVLPWSRLHLRLSLDPAPLLELVLAPMDLGSVREPLLAPAPAQDPELL